MKESAQCAGVQPSTMLAGWLAERSSWLGAGWLRASSRGLACGRPLAIARCLFY
jgi:hypothetical protein